MAPPMAPPNPIKPATEPTEVRGKTSVGRVMISPDQDCWPKKAMLKSNKAKLTETCGTRITAGMSAALRPRGSLREKLRECPCRNNRLENQPPAKLPKPEAA